MKENFGNVYVNFGSPISVSSFFGKTRRTNVIGPKHVKPITEDERKVILHVAQEIVNVQQQLCTISVFNLMAVVLANNFLQGNTEGLSLERISDEVAWLRNIIEIFGATVSAKNMLEDVCIAINIHKSIVGVDDNQVVYVKQHDVISDEINASKLKGHRLSAKTMSSAVPYVWLQLYINPTLFYFTSPALITIIVKRNIGGIDRGEVTIFFLNVN